MPARPVPSLQAAAAVAASRDAQLHQAHTLLGQGNAAAAEVLYRQLLNAGLENASLLSNLGVICWQSGRHGEMEQLLRQALQLEPTNADAHYNLALVLAQRGAAAEAIAHYRQALPLASSRLQGSIHWNLSKLLLRQGDYAAGWQHYEWRRHKAQPLLPICQPGMPAWDGRTPLEGELVLVGEQGLGDMLQFLRYAPAMAAFAPRVALGLPEKLHGLVRSSNLPVQLLSPAELSAQRHGHWLPLLSAPGLLGVRPEAVQVEAPYLQVPPERVAHWRLRLRAELAPGERLVGLHWQGNPATETSELRGRSLPLQTLAQLAALAGLRFVSLQKGPGSEQLAGSAVASRLVACQGAVDACWDFVDTGAIALACDLLISSDSALVHLAGALGVPTWLLLHHSSDWRWGEAGDTSFWYPSLRLFRQQQPGDWGGVIARVVEALGPTAAASAPKPGSPAIQEEQVEALIQRGQRAEAEVQLRREIAAGSENPKAFNLLAVICGMEGRTDEARTLLNRSLALDPHSAEAHNNLGLVHQRLHDAAAAIACFRRALDLRPNNPDASFNLGNALALKGERAAAIDAYRDALRLRPDHLDTLVNLGITLDEHGDPATAIETLQAALKIQPHYPEVHNRIGNVRLGQDDLAGACAAYRQALALRPNDLDAQLNLGVALQRQGQIEAAIAAFEAVLSLQPDHPAACNHLGNARYALGRIDAAIACYDNALRANADFSEARGNRSLALLLRGDYEAGWPGYDARLAGEPGNTLLCATPPCQRWDGTALSASAQLLLVAEQGLGDTLQFMRYVPLLRRQGILVRLCAPAKLHGLIQASGIDPAPLTPSQARSVRDGYWLPLLSLPQHLGVSPADPLVTQPYIRVAQERIAAWRDGLAQERRPIIALNWQGNPKAERTALRGRSLPLEALAPIAAAQAGTLLSLQKGPGSEQLERCSFRRRFASCQQQVDAALDFQDTAAILANCDLVITTDTCMAHLAGGLGVPTWLLLHHIPDWRWGLEGDRSFWYPSLRLFRQQRRGDWEGVIARVVEALGPARAERPVAEREAQALQLLQQNRLAEAEALYRQLLADDAASATVPANLGVICAASGRLEEAVPLLEQALRRDPHHLSALANLGEARCQQDAWEQAEPLLRRVLELNPNHLQALNRLRSLESRAGRQQEALALARRIVALAPAAPEAHYNLGVEAKAAGELAEARASYEQALVLRPDDADAQANLSMILLLQGEYSRGLELREARLRKTNPVQPIVQPELPRWVPAAPPSGPLLVVGEQGLGDMLQFLRYVPCLQQRGLHPRLCLPEKLVELARTSGIAATVLSPEQLDAATPQAQWWVPLLSLPWHLGVTPEQPLVSAPYLRTTPERQRHWRQRLVTGQPLVALHWQGNIETGNLIGRSLPLDTLAPLSDVEGITLLSLQKGYGSEQLAGCSFRARFHPHQGEVDASWSFLDTAAMLQACDLLISSDSALAHLAGSLGVPTWLLLHHIPDWRWGLEGDRSFWYPSLRLFRQRRPGDWAEVIQRVQGELQRWRDQGRRAP